MDSQSTPKAKTAMNWMASLMLVQFISRMLHFALNLVIIRFMSPENYGLSALQLPFVSTAITRILKESLHRVAVREKDEDSNEKKVPSKGQNLVLVWWSIPIGIILSTSLGLVFLYTSKDALENPWIAKGLFLWLSASWLEIIIEPVIIYLESNLIMNITVVVEVISLTIQCAVTIILLFNLEAVVLLQSYGQFIYALSLFIGYYGYALWWNKSSWSSIWPSSFKITSQMIHSIKPFIIQSLGKYVTAEGEHAVLFFFGNKTQQGVFEFVHNIGSIVARIAFLSIEKTGFVIFTRLKNDSEKVTEREKIWKMLMNVSLMISLLYLSVCPVYIFFLIDLVYGDKWSSSNAPYLISFYGVYLLLIGVNGLVEAHRDAISPYERIQKQTPYTIGMIILYFLISAPSMYYLGAFGLILSSCISTLIRCIFNIRFFAEYSFSVFDGIPNWDILVVYSSIFLTGMISRYIQGDTWRHFGFGVVQGVVFLIWLYFFQFKKLKETWWLMKQKNKAE